MSAKKPLRNGRRASTVGAPPSNALNEPSKALAKLLAAVYNQFQRLDNRAANAEARRDFVFHMTDWLDDLDRLQAIYHHPEQWDREEAGREIAGFLYHVIPHLKAAGRLLLDEVPDAFEPARTDQ
jgi:hypothetical protein